MAQQKVVYACDIGGSKLLCGFVTEAGEIIDTEKTPLPEDITPQFLEERVEEKYRILCSRNPDCRVTACGMNIPGVADAEKGIWVYACFSGISDYPVAERMQQRLGLKVTIANDVNACAWAEKVYGCCRDCEDYLWVTVSNGVGGGLVLGGRLYEGICGGAGEIGHVVVVPEGLPCDCGHRGCLEAMASGQAIARRYQQLTGEKRTAAEIADKARKGEEAALFVLRKTGEYVGSGLGKAASLLNVKKYVLGGGVMQSFDLMEEELRAAFEKEAFRRPNREAEVCLTALKYEAGLLGAAAIVWENTKGA